MSVWKFTGDERDSETGLDHTLFRQYSSSLGRWSSPDPLAGDISDPQSLNRYSYVLNNPLAYADSLGADPNCGDGARPCPLLAEDGDDFGCSLDGISTSCGYINGLVRNGLADPCPGNNCNGVQSFLNANGTSSTYQLQYVKQWLCCQIANIASTVQLTGYSREGYAYVLASVLQYLNTMGANFAITASLSSRQTSGAGGGGGFSPEQQRQIFSMVGHYAAPVNDPRGIAAWYALSALPWTPEIYSAGSDILLELEAAYPGVSMTASDIVDTFLPGPANPGTRAAAAAAITTQVVLPIWDWIQERRHH